MPAARFITLDTLMEVLAISGAQAYALVRAGELPAIQVGSRGQWRVEVTQLEAYIQRQYQASGHTPLPAPGGREADGASADHRGSGDTGL